LVYPRNSAISDRRLFEPASMRQAMFRRTSASIWL
jgi:hypothetical protein